MEAQVDGPVFFKGSVSEAVSDYGCRAWNQGSTIGAADV